MKAFYARSVESDRLNRLNPILDLEPVQAAQDVLDTARQMPARPGLYLPADAVAGSHGLVCHLSYRAKLEREWHATLFWVGEPPPLTPGLTLTRTARRRVGQEIQSFSVPVGTLC